MSGIGFGGLERRMVREIEWLGFGFVTRLAAFRSHEAGAGGRGERRGERRRHRRFRAGLAETGHGEEKHH
jgi:hypothetical protein